IAFAPRSHWRRSVNLRIAPSLVNLSGSQFPLADGSFPLRDLPNASRRRLVEGPPRIPARASAKRLKCQHFTSARFHRGRILAADHDDPGEDPMFEQTI